MLFLVQGHGRTTHIHWLLLGQLGPACAGKLLGGGWPCAGTLEIQLKFNRNFNEYQWKSNLDQSEALILAQIFGNNDYSQTELSRHVEF